MYSADYSDNEDDDAADHRDVLKETRKISWDTILQQVEDDIPTCTGTILELSDPNIFMLLTFDPELLNDLFSWNHQRAKSSKRPGKAQRILHRCMIKEGILGRKTSNPV